MSDIREEWYWVRVGSAPWTPSRLTKSGHPMIAERGMAYQLGPKIPTPDEMGEDGAYRTKTSAGDSGHPGVLIHD